MTTDSIASHARDIDGSTRRIIRSLREGDYLACLRRRDTDVELAARSRAATSGSIDDGSASDDLDLLLHPQLLPAEVDVAREGVVSD